MSDICIYLPFRPICTACLTFPIFSMLHLKDSRHTKYGFCGSNIGMGLPVPCREPLKGHDYGLFVAHGQMRSEQPNTANDINWRCSVLQVQARASDSTRGSAVEGQMTKRSRIEFEILPVPEDARKSSEPASPGLAEVHSTVQVSPELTIRIEPPTRVSKDLCGGNRALTACFLACCDSL